MIGGIILLTLAFILWFGMANQKSAEESAATGFMYILKKAIGPKGYIIMAKVLAVICFLSACTEFYKYFTAS